jgi:hypothetical protein
MMCYRELGSTFGCLVGRQKDMEYDTEQLQFAAVAATRSAGIFLLLALCSLVAFGSSKKPVEFPGPQAKLQSPDGRYVVENVDSDKEPHHTLRLKSAATGTVRTLCSYQRHVTVLWSPDGKKLVVNDYAGSDFSRVLIFSADRESPLVNVGAELLQSLRDSPDRRSLADNQHVYFAVSGWEGKESVKLKVWGYGQVDPKGFSRWYQYTLGGSFHRLH